MTVKIIALLKVSRASADNCRPRRPFRWSFKWLATNSSTSNWNKTNK